MYKKKYMDMEMRLIKMRKYRRWARWKTTDYLVDALLLACRCRADDDFINVLRKEIKEREGRAWHYGIHL